MNEAIESAVQSARPSWLNALCDHKVEWHNALENMNEHQCNELLDLLDSDRLSHFTSSILRTTDVAVQMQMLARMMVVVLLLELTERK